MRCTVPEVPNNPISRVLHIRSNPHSAPTTDPLAALTTETPGEIETCSDVYRGLARALTDENKSIQAIIICLDDLTTGEFEIFTILSQRRRDLPLYVYSPAPEDERVAKAISLGATGRLTREIVDQLARACQSPTIEQPQIVQDDKAAPPPATSGARDGAEETADRPRVPWLSYENKLERQKPSGPSKPAKPKPPMHVAPTNDEFDPAPLARQRSYEPLLSAEEMQALKSDDISAIAPEPRESTDNDAFRADERSDS